MAATAGFLDCLNSRVLAFDGAMGTSIHARDIPLSDYQNRENCSEILSLTRPDAIEDIHRSFLDVGCDIVETNTFGANRLVLAEFDLVDRCRELNAVSAQIARRAADAFSTPDKPRFVAGSMGPGTKLVSLRQTTYDALVDSYAEQVRGLIDGGVDLLIIETCQDILQIKAAIQACRTAFSEHGVQLPIVCQVTVETTGTLLVGSDIAAALTAIDPFPEVVAVGLNCATGPQEMSEHVRYLAQNSTRAISVQPNAGLPQVVNGEAYFPLTPAEFAKWLREFVVDDGVSLIGGCCGTTPAHLKAAVEAVQGLVPKQRRTMHEPSVSSLYQSMSMRQDKSFLIIGERCNTNGSRKFKRLLIEGDLDGLVEAAQEQQADSHVIDVCVDCVGRDGAKDMHWLVDRFARDVTLPLMLDSTQADVLEAGLKLSGGKCIINSVNLEEGEERVAKIAGMCRQYGAAVVALVIDEDPQEAMAKTADRKLAIAQRLHKLLTEKHGMPEHDIFFDCLTFPITTGSESDRRLALETLNGVERVMQALPNCQSVLGVSNVSFGLQPAARVVLNSVFLHEARQRGLTAAIVHASKILPLNQIGEERWNAALDLIYDQRANGDPLERFIGLFAEGEKLGEAEDIEQLPVEERLKRRIIDGKKSGVEADLDEAMQRYSPVEIINTLLLDGMKTVGELFGAGEMQLPFVLKSAETMKTAVAHLEPHMDKVAGESRGKIILATVRGDVHDIGKNLVDIILSNNGYEVVNLGIKQPIANVITALREHDADAVGLSGLLVKSTLVMRDDLQTLKEQNIDVPVILGGAALTRRYVEEDLRPIYTGRVDYAKDAFEGLRLMDDIVKNRRSARAAQPGADAAPVAPDPAARSAEQLGREAEQRYGLVEVPDDDSTTPASNAAPAVATLPRAEMDYSHPVPQPPFWGARVVEDIALKAALGYINEIMLFQVQWGFRKKGRPNDEFKQYIDREVRPIYRDLVDRCLRDGVLQPKAVYGYWPCNSDGDRLIVYAPPTDGGPVERRELVRFTFPRQQKKPYWCLSDFWRPASDGVTDVVAFQLVTAGPRVSEVAREWFAKNEYQQYLFLHGLGVETAEALAEYMHKQIRMELGVADQDEREMRKLFQQGYQGSRYSFGYPACPNLEDQTLLMTLLQPERIGVTLSEEHQLDPEQSTSAIVAYHPAARYFNVR